MVFAVLKQLELCKSGRAPLSTGHACPAPRWMPETADGTSAHMRTYRAPRPCVAVTKSALRGRLSKRLTAMTRNKVEWLQQHAVTKAAWTRHRSVERGSLDPVTADRGTEPAEGRTGAGSDGAEALGRGASHVLGGRSGSREMSSLLRTVRNSTRIACFRKLPFHFSGLQLPAVAETTKRTVVVGGGGSRVWLHSPENRRASPSQSPWTSCGRRPRPACPSLPLAAPRCPVPAHSLPFRSALWETPSASSPSA